MSVVTEISPDGQKLTISIKGRFDFGRHQEFRESYERLNKTPESIVVDLKDTPAKLQDRYLGKQGGAAFRGFHALRASA